MFEQWKFPAKNNNKNPDGWSSLIPLSWLQDFVLLASINEDQGLFFFVGFFFKGNKVNTYCHKITDNVKTRGKIHRIVKTLQISWLTALYSHAYPDSSLAGFQA